MKTLLLMRHAKSDWDADYAGDHDRPLNRRGVESARLIGRALHERDLVPDLIISSTAVRARSTAEHAIDAGGWDSELRLDPQLYDSGPEGVLEAAGLVGEADRLMLVGHQPTWSMLVRRLSGETVEMKTATVAVIDLEMDRWPDLASSTGRLTQVLYPRALAGAPGAG